MSAIPPRHVNLGLACERFLSVSLNRACTFRDHFFSSPDFHEFRRSMMSISVLTEVKQQWVTSVLGWVTV